MSFGAHTFGGGYFGGGPAISTGPETITGTGACVLGSLTCSGTGTVPSHGPQQTVWGLSGVTSVPLKPRKKLPRRIVGLARMSVGALSCDASGLNRHRRKGTAACSLSPLSCGARGELLEGELVAVALGMMDDPGSRFGILLDQSWR